MQSFKTPKEFNSNDDSLFKNGLEYENYYLIKNNNAYKFIVGKNETEVFIKNKNYEIKLTNNDLSLLTNLKFNSINESYKFIKNFFDESKALIIEIKINKTIKLILKNNISNKDIEITLLYNKTNNELSSLSSTKSVNELQKELNDEKKKNKILEQKIKELTLENNELKNKLARNPRNPYEFSERENLFSINFISIDMRIKFSVICKDSDIFCNIEQKLYEKYPEYTEKENYFMANGRLVKRFKSLKENGIKNNDVIVLSSYED